MTFVTLFIASIGRKHIFATIVVDTFAFDFFLWRVMGWDIRIVCECCIFIVMLTREGRNFLMGGDSDVGIVQGDENFIDGLSYFPEFVQRIDISQPHVFDSLVERCSDLFFFIACDVVINISNEFIFAVKLVI